VQAWERITGPELAKMGAEAIRKNAERAFGDAKAAEEFMLEVETLRLEV